MFTFGLLSGSVSGFRSAPGLTVLPLKKKKKSALLVVKPLHVFQALGGHGMLGSVFLFPRFCWGKGLCLGYNNHMCPVSSPLLSQYPEALTLHSAQLHGADTNKPPCFAPLWSIREVRCGVKLHPQFSLLAGWAAARTRSLPSIPQFPFWKNICGHHCH